MAKNINFDEGYKEYTINNDPDRVIRINTADYGIVERFNGAQKRLQDIAKGYENVALKPDGSPEEEAAMEMIVELGGKIKCEVNYLLGSDVSDIVFNGQSPLSTVGGIPLYERFVNSVIPFIKADMEAEVKASEKRVAKYTKQAKPYSKKGRA